MVAGRGALFLLIVPLLTLSHILSRTTVFPFRKCFKIDVVVRDFLSILLVNTDGAAGDVRETLTGVGDGAKGEVGSQRLGRVGVWASGSAGDVCSSCRSGAGFDLNRANIDVENAGRLNGLSVGDVNVDFPLESLSEEGVRLVNGLATLGIRPASIWNKSFC